MIGTPAAEGERGLFLDLDGTLADSLTGLRRVYHDFLARFGATGSEAEFQSLNGPPLAAIIDTLRAAHGLTPPAPVLRELYADLIARDHGTAPPAPGARAVLVQARHRGWVVAVVTSGARDPARVWLERAGLDALVDVVVGGDEVRRGKPDPEPYRLALGRTGCIAARSLAVEDSTHGARSAAAAGLPVWLLAPTLPPHLEGLPGLLGLLPNLAALAQVL
jgi:HAD superfamily hydrolase (TIGR01509 family)